ncbi:Protein kinase domain-containing protein [Mycena indigotica]|uniref:Protein kinase domain-containing protein n=1 Tax=Mycena indigotica TaxID=2126181 RepID=A0A8H6SD81_9AGAR|nr:Protein kinase domain-containing protein [Mycena indigotica]KAF7297313.1 Protein kinase domain-containing protein [Mycena indigotica]
MLEFNPRDIYWLEHRSFLEASGYRLRPKFNPEYILNPNPAARREDWATHTRHTIMDAHRISDGQPVMLKAVSTRIHPHEVEIARLFSSPPLSEDPKNHCIPIFDVLTDPDDTDKQIIVMPRLLRFDRPMFETVGEVVDCFRQIFEGIEFMHQNFVAHRDCWGPNLAQDPSLLFPDGFHPIYISQDPQNQHKARHISRTECWPRFFLLDFGLSRRYDPANGPPLERVIYGGDRSPPEQHKRPAICNPFPTDIYVLGNLLKNDFVYSRRLGKKSVILPSLRFLEPLVEAMTRPDPATRPTIGEVIDQLDVLCNDLSSWHLRRPGRKYAFNLRLFFQQIMRTLKRVPPLPQKASQGHRPALSESIRMFYTEMRLPMTTATIDDCELHEK